MFEEDSFWKDEKILGKDRIILCLSWYIFEK